MTKLVFMGTNGWYDTENNTISTLVQGSDFHLIFDAGNGIAKLNNYLEDDCPVYLFISHFHLDHIVGLHTLDKYPFRGGLTIIVPDGGRAHLETIMNAPFSVPSADLSFTTTIVEVPAEIDQLPFKVQVLPLKHTVLTLGLQTVFQGRKIAYCPDTGYCQNAVQLASGADILITECAFRPGQSDDVWPHLNPEQAARIAREAQAQVLYLTHFDPVNYPTPASRDLAVQSAATIFSPVYAARDDLLIEF